MNWVLLSFPELKISRIIPRKPLEKSHKETVTQLLVLRSQKSPADPTKDSLHANRKRDSAGGHTA